MELLRNEAALFFNNSEWKPTVPPSSVMYGHFWQSLFDGVPFVPLDSQRVESLADSLFFSFPPITTLTTQEEDRLRKVAVSNIGFCVNEEYFPFLVNGPVVFLTDEQWPNVLRANQIPACKYNLLTGNTALKLMEEGALKLTAPEIAGVLINPSHTNGIRVFFDNPDRAGHVIGLSIGSTCRGFFNTSGESSYGFSHDEFEEILKMVRTNTGKKRLLLCDFGGSVGRAVWDIQQAFPDIEAINIAPIEEFSEYPVRKMLAYAERVPLSFKDSVDIIVSNFAWRYFIYPDIALRNVIQALSPGGYASIIYEDEGNPRSKYHISREEIKERTVQLLIWMAELKAEGIIDYEPLPYDESGSLCGRIQIHKKKRCE